MDITLNEAEAVTAAAKAKALELGLTVNIAIVDGGANLKTFLRMDDAMLGAGDIAIKKAKTARFFNMESGEVGKLSQPGGPLFQIEFSNGGLITFPGGLPIKNNTGEIIGAIGISGGTVEQDLEIATAGAAIIN